MDGNLAAARASTLFPSNVVAFVGLAHLAGRCAPCCRARRQPEAGGRVRYVPAHTRRRSAAASLTACPTGALPSATGPLGIVLKGDVLAALSGSGARAAASKGASAASSGAAASAQPSAAPSSSSLPPRRRGARSGPGYTEIPLTNMRKVIARRLGESKSQIPHEYMTVEVDMSRLMAQLQRVRAKADVKVSMNDLIIQHVAVAMSRVPDALPSGAADVQPGDVDVAVAVATDSGLITPIVRGANRKSVVDIGKETPDLFARARDGKLKPEEFSGGSCSISNMGMLGIGEFTAVINPPQSCIFAIGAVRKTLGPDNAVVPRMAVSLSHDSSLVDEATAGRLLDGLRSLMEEGMW